MLECYSMFQEGFFSLKHTVTINYSQSQLCGLNSTFEQKLKCLLVHSCVFVFYKVAVRRDAVSSRYYCCKPCLSYYLFLHISICVFLSLVSWAVRCVVIVSLSVSWSCWRSEACQGISLKQYDEKAAD